MSDVEFILRLALAAALTAWLGLRHWKRWTEHIEAAERSAEANWIGSAFDAGSATPKIQALRRDYLAGLHCHAPDLHRRESLIASARQALAQFSYFQKAEIEDWEHETQAHAA